MTFYHPCPSPKIKAGSGLALATTVITFGSPKIETEITVSTESTDLTASIATIIDLAVV